jgi:glycine dehydrogenase
MHPLDASDSFQARHIGPSPSQRNAMLEAIGVPSLDALIDEAVPLAIRQSGPLSLPPPLSEHEYLSRLSRIAGRNQVARSYIGLGYHDTITPPVIQRMVLENPGWYTPYTPYQAEIAQGRLESLLNFQTAVVDLTGLPVANASLLDEATAAAEAMALMHRVHRGTPSAAARRLLVSDGCLPQSIAVIRSRAEPIGIEVEVTRPSEFAFDADVFGAVLQYPDQTGSAEDLAPLIARAHEAGALVAVGTDLLALTLLTPPGEMGADVAYGNSQRFGVPLACGGPHAAFFAARSEFVRQMPGRIIGVSADAAGKTAYRMALATREQHIRREKATSNICTAQALLANVAAMYAVYHGPEGLTAIATRVHTLARVLADELVALGLRQTNGSFFDTLRVEMPSGTADLHARAAAAGMNFRPLDERTAGISLNETSTTSDVRDIVDVFCASLGTAPRGSAVSFPASIPDADDLPARIRRHSAFLTHPVFSAHRSETSMMRYIRALERKDIGLDASMIPLGSCTMKLNPAAGMIPITWRSFTRIHPFAPPDQMLGYAQVVSELESALAEITGLPAVSLQPNSGAQGEFAGLLAIRAFHRDRGDAHRDVVLIPASAHGTNPASAAMAGLRVVVVATAADGSVDVADLRRKTTAHRDRLACLMITYPSTHGVFEDAILDICADVHAHGGQVYMDGANMNAQVGVTSPAAVGADICHLNLHKTFAIPHGGGGPGMGPICAAPHLAPYLPGHPLAGTGGTRATGAVSAAPWGSPGVLLVSHAYVQLLGAEGLRQATRHAILNANYIKARLETHYPVLYARGTGRVAHELVFDLRAFKAAGIEEMDVAKRLIDYGFHAPTVSFPVAGTLMVEPTESEEQPEIDRFCDAMIQIRREIDDVVSGRVDRDDNVLKHAPHTAVSIAAAEWTHAYTREQAAFPLAFVRANKLWPSVGRIDNAYGDRNLFCTCPPVE